MSNISDKFEEKKENSIDKDLVSSFINPLTYLSVVKQTRNFFRKHTGNSYNILKGAISTYRENGDFPKDYFKSSHK